MQDARYRYNKGANNRPYDDLYGETRLSYYMYITIQLDIFRSGYNMARDPLHPPRPRNSTPSKEGGKPHRGGKAEVKINYNLKCRKKPEETWIKKLTKRRSVPRCRTSTRVMIPKSFQNPKVPKTSRKHS